MRRNARYTVWAVALFAASPLGCSPLEPGGGGSLHRACAAGDATGEGQPADATGEGQPSEAAMPDTLDTAREGKPRWRGPLKTWTEYACEKVGATGCCKGEVLWWCEGGVLRSRHCTALKLPRCGWNSTSARYACGTAGAPDPMEKYPRECIFAAPNGWLPDSGRAADNCVGIASEGCCVGNVLKYCQGGKVQVMDCALNPTCGWQPNGQQYDCGTAGMSDPKGAHKKACPGTTPGDGVPDRGMDATVDGAGDTAGGPGDNGCSCRVSEAPVGPWILLAVLLLATRRRMSV